MCYLWLRHSKNISALSCSKKQVWDVTSVNGWYYNLKSSPVVVEDVLVTVFAEKIWHVSELMMQQTTCLITNQKVSGLNPGRPVFLLRLRVGGGHVIADWLKLHCSGDVLATALAAKTASSVVLPQVTKSLKYLVVSYKVYSQFMPKADVCENCNAGSTIVLLLAEKRRLHLQKINMGSN